MVAPTYKSIYFRDYPKLDSRRKALTLAVGPGEPTLAKAIRSMSSDQLRTAIGFSSYTALLSAADAEDLPVHTFCIRALKAWLRNRNEEAGAGLPGLGGPISHLITFSEDQAAPFQRWFPLLEGYSLSFVELLLAERARGATRVLDPFAGVGTTPLAVALRGSSAFYAEVNPALQKVAAAKLKALALNQEQRATVVSELRSLAHHLPAVIEVARADQELRDAYLRTFGGSEFFDDQTLEAILSVRRVIDVLETKLELTSDLLEIAAIASLQPASFLIRAGDLRYRKGRELGRMETFADGLLNRVLAIADDIEATEGIAGRPLLVAQDAQCLDRIPPLGIEAVVTSPPYLNGTNYIRNTKLELWFVRALKSKSDLRSYRDATITAGINDVRGTEVPVSSETARAVIFDLKKNAYDSRIPRMVSSYLNGMSRVFGGLATHMKVGAPVFLDIGDSAYAGIHVPTDKLLAEVAADHGFRLLESEVLRTRVSRTGIALSQTLLTFEFVPPKTNVQKREAVQPPAFTDKWESFKAELPHQGVPYAKRNWGNARHSICSYQGKMKPSLARHLVDVFAPENGVVLDPFAGVGTIPFEACLTGRRGIGFDISPAALAIMKAKLTPPNRSQAVGLIDDLEEYLSTAKIDDIDRFRAREVAFNGPLEDYFHETTFDEILAARAYLQCRQETPAKAFVLACLLHILHGNRPYALSRRSHSMTPFAPTGPTEYRALIPRLREKVRRMIDAPLPESFVEGEALLQDATAPWPGFATEVDAIITSPPFFDSTRFYLANWMRLWFCGWEREDFTLEPRRYVDERQKLSFTVYQAVLRQARERLKQGGVLVLHLGKSRKSNMSEALVRVSTPWFRVVDRFDESVTHTESHGIRDKGTVTSHQYLVLA